MAVLLRRRPAAPPRAAVVRRTPQPGQIRALRASAWRVEPGNRDQTAALRAVRQAWQPTAWHYRKTVGPLRYGCVFLRNIARRVILFPAAHVPDERVPVPVEDSDLARYAGICHDALDRLGDHGPLLAANMESFEVAGECALVSRIDDGDGLRQEVWEIRSTSEVSTTEDGKILIRDAPGATGWAGSDTYELQEEDFFARLWTPDPEWRRLADSPVRAAEPILEELSLLLAERRSTTVSRLATNGILLLPDTLSVVRMSAEESADDEDDPWLAMLAEAVATAIQKPGSAEAAIPIVGRGPVEAIKEVRHLLFERPTADNPEKWKEALSALAITLDMPPEVLTGSADLNHWSKWGVDESTFRDHAEPLVQETCSGWTAGYFRWYLIEAGVPPEDAARLLVWYDPSEAVAKPDMAQAAKDAFDKDALSWEALRKHLGFTEDEAPDEEELVTHLLLRSRMDPATTAELIQLLDPRLKPAPVVVALPPAGPGQEPPGDGAPVEGPPPADGPPEPTAPGMATRIADLRARRLAEGHPAEMHARVVALRQRRTAATQPTTPPDRHIEEAARISRRMAERDARLRETLRMAAEQACKRVLERAGSKVLTKARQKDSLAAAACREMPTWAVPARLGTVVVAALGLAEDQLLDIEFAELAALWDRYVSRGQEQALADAARLVGLDPADAIAVLDGRLRGDRRAGWEFLRAALEVRLRAALAADPTEAVQASQLVPTGAVRAGLAIAGGFLLAHSAGISASTFAPVDPTEFYGQLGTGPTISGYLESRGLSRDRYEWSHGASMNPFPPHEALDGLEFASWDDARLEHEGFARGMHPGDHQGCSCDTILVWVPTERAADREEIPT